jgi:adenylate cyclase
MKKNIFQEQYEKELLQSEKRRILILLTIFSLALAARLVNLVVPLSKEGNMAGESLSALWIFPAVIISFELLTLLLINRKIKSEKKDLPVYLQYINAILEVSLPSAVIFFIARQFPSFSVLESPVVFIYFMYIILSTLRLNFKLSLLYGLLSAVAYTLFSITLYHRFDASDAGRALILLFSGVAAGFVARQIKSGIEKSLMESGKRQKAENLFGKQLSPEIAKQLLRSNGKMESKRMKVAVLFLDIRNFTQFTVGKTPEEIVCYQNAFFDIVIETIGRHGGIVNQILGDGCMATFGAPVQHPNPSSPAVSAARELLENLARAVKTGSLPATRIGIGVHTGEAVTGNIGNSERQQYSITGEVVIVASRIEQLNKQFQSQLLVSGDVYRAIEYDRAVTEVYRDIPLKGFENPLTVYKLA